MVCLILRDYDWPHGVCQALTLTDLEVGPPMKLEVGPPRGQARYAK